MGGGQEFPAKRAMRFPGWPFQSSAVFPDLNDSDSRSGTIAEGARNRVFRCQVQVSEPAPRHHCMPHRKLFLKHGETSRKARTKVRVPCPGGHSSSPSTVPMRHCNRLHLNDEGQSVPRMDVRYASLPGGCRGFLSERGSLFREWIGTPACPAGAVASFCTASIAGDFLFPWFSVRTGQSVPKMDARYASLPGGCRGFVLHGVHRG